MMSASSQNRKRNSCWIFTSDLYAHHQMVTLRPLKVVDLTCKELWSWKQSLKPALTRPEEVIAFEPDLKWKPCSQMPSLVSSIEFHLTAILIQSVNRYTAS